METRCPGCMKIKHQHPQCEHCGFLEHTRNELHQLPVGTVLRDQYVIGRVLGQGGFGITYLAWDRNLEEPVAIKEYFPSGQVSRNTTMSWGVTCNTGSLQFQEGRDRFLREAQTLAKLRRLSSIAQVHNFFAANNTAYIIMEYVEGITLQNYVRQRGGRLTPAETFAVLRPVIQAMQQVHQEGMIHRDISPDNIMLQRSGTVKILDFGTARDVDPSGVATHSTQAILKHGFAPFEQYQSRGNLGPWTDEYALCATAYYCMTGRVPTEASSRLMDGDTLNWDQIPGLLPHQKAALSRGMAVKPGDRFPNLVQLEAALYGSGYVPPVDTKDKGKRGGRKKWLLPVIASAVAVVALVTALAILGGRKASEPSMQTPPVVVQEETQVPTEAPATEAPAEPTFPPDNWKNNVMMKDIVEIGGDIYYAFGSEYLRSDFVSITFVDTLEDAPADAWDISQKGNGSVMAWTVSKGSKYELYIGGNGGVCAPTSCETLFYKYTEVKKIDLEHFHFTNAVTNIKYMFSCCYMLPELDLKDFDTSGVTNMWSTFFFCQSLTYLDLRSFDTSRVTDMGWMFACCDKLEEVDIRSFNTSRVTDMSYMFYSCPSLTTVSLDVLDTSNVTDYEHFLDDGVTYNKRPWIELFE